MDTRILIPGQQIGVFYYDGVQGTKATIEEIERVTPSGQVILKSGKRYTNKGDEVEHFFLGSDNTRLCPVVEAQALINKGIERELSRQAKKQAYLESPEGRQDSVVKGVKESVRQILNQHGWYVDVDGKMDVLELEIGQIVREYVKNYPPIN